MKLPTFSLADPLPVEQSAPDRRVSAMGVSLAAAFAFCYAPVVIGMVRQWWNISFYSYAFLIPVVSAYLVWIRRDQLLAIKPQPHYMFGAVLVALGLSALVVGRVGGVQAIEQISLLITLPGVVLWLFGSEVLKALSLPIAFLWFMLPIWEVVTDPLHLPFQFFSADLGVRLLRVFGIPVYQEGLFIYLPNITLEVARSCSGVNYLIAVLATSIPLATIVLADVWKRVVLVLLAMTVSAFANSLRVALIGILAYYDLSGDLHGPYHTLHGVFVSLIGYVVIFGGLWVLSREQTQVAAVRSARLWNFEWKHVRKSWAFLAVVLMVVGAVGYVDRSQAVQLRQNLSELSLENAGWIGREAPVVENVPGADQVLSRSYRALSGEAVTLGLWYFETQTQGKELIWVGTGNLHAEARRIKLNLVGHGEVEVNRRVVREGDSKRVILFWYDLNGRILASPEAVKLYTTLDAIAHGRTNGALVWVAISLPPDDQAAEDQAGATLQKFIEALSPVLGHHLPSAAG